MSWEMSKENVQPLRSGRRLESLEASNASQTNLRAQQDYFERELRTCDGLDPWMAYVKWTEQTYTSDSRHLVALLEKAIARFKDDQGVNKDPRYLDLWIKYSSLSKESPLDVFAFLYDHELCTSHCRFYEVWADHLEAFGNVKKAAAVFKKALEIFRNDEEAVNSLKVKQDRFHMRQFQLTLQQSDGEVGTSREQENERVQLASLRADDNQVASQRTGHAILNNGPGKVALSNNNSSWSVATTVNTSATKKAGRNENNNARFAIYTDENANPGCVLKQPSSRRQDVVSGNRNAENEQKPSQWPKAAGVATSKRFVPVMPTKPDFNIHRDEQQDLNVNKPTSEQSENRRMGIEMRALCTKKKSEVADVNCPLAIFEPPDPSVKPMYCKHLVYQGVTEFSFEELRAANYEKAMEEERSAMRKREQLEEEERLNLQRAKVEMELDKALRMQKVLEQEKAAIKREKDELERLKAQMRPRDESLPKEETGAAHYTYTPSNTEAAACQIQKPPLHNLQSPTVNTKEALALVQGLWDQGGHSSHHDETTGTVQDEVEDVSSLSKISSSAKKTPSFQTFDDLEAVALSSGTNQGPTNLPFAIYSDSIRVDNNCNKENNDPAGKMMQTNSDKGALKSHLGPTENILLPSKTIPMAHTPDDDEYNENILERESENDSHGCEKHEKQDNNKGSFELMPPPSYQGNKSVTSRTMLIPSVEEFEQFAQISSTPFHGRRNFAEDLDADTCHVEIITKAKALDTKPASNTNSDQKHCDVADANSKSAPIMPQIKDNFVACQKNVLSPIFETSSELNYKSSSSSGSQTMWSSQHHTHTTANSYQLHQSNVKTPIPRTLQSNTSTNNGLKTPGVNIDISSGYVADSSAKTPQQSSFWSSVPPNTKQNPAVAQKNYSALGSSASKSGYSSSDRSNTHLRNSNQRKVDSIRYDGSDDDDDLMDEGLMKLVQNYRRETQQKSDREGLHRNNDKTGDGDESLWSKDTMLLPRQDEGACYTSLVEQESFLERMKNSSMRRINDDEQDNEITFSDI